MIIFMSYFNNIPPKIVQTTDQRKKKNKTEIFLLFTLFILSKRLQWNLIRKESKNYIFWLNGLCCCHLPIKICKEFQKFFFFLRKSGYKLSFLSNKLNCEFALNIFGVQGIFIYTQIIMHVHAFKLMNFASIFCVCPLWTLIFIYYFSIPFNIYFAKVNI